MRSVAIIVLLWSLPGLAQQKPAPTGCLNLVGPIMYPAFEWGAEEESLVIASIRIVNDGKAEIIAIDYEEKDWESFQLEVQKSLLSSSFDARCSGQTFDIIFRFKLEGDRIGSRIAETKIIDSDTVSVVAHPPPEFLCEFAALNDDDAEALHGRSGWFFDQKDFAAALRCAEASIAWKPVADAFMYKGIALNRLKRSREAIAAYDDAEKLNPLDPDIFFDRGCAYRDLRQYDRAIEDFTKSIEIEPQPRSFLNRAVIYDRLHRYDLALEDATSAIKLNPRYAKGYEERCTIRFFLDDLKSALQDCNKALEMDPFNYGAFSGRACILIAQGKYEHALKDLTKAIEIEPLLMTSYVERGQLYLFLKRFREAEADLSEAIRLFPEDARSYRERASAREALGDKNGAKEDREKAKKLGNGEYDIFLKDPVTGLAIPMP